MFLLPFGLAHAHLQAPLEDTQGSGSTGDDFDDAADDALVAEGEAEMDTDEDGDPESTPDPDAQLDDEESQDEEEEEEEETDDEQPVAAAGKGFKFKDPKTGNFDWKRINGVLGGDELEKSIREQNATITKYSQENKTLKESIGSPEAFKETQNKAGFFDHLMNTHPGIRAEVLKVLHGEQAAQSPQSGNQLPAGVDPNDPLAPLVMQQQQVLMALQNRLQEGDRAQQQRQQEHQFLGGLKEARAKFRELLGKEPTEEQMLLVAKEMQSTGVLKGARFVPDLFFQEIQDAIRAKYLSENAEKRKKLSKTGLGRKAGSGKKRGSMEEDFNALWDEHMS